ncbi:hypothetical protein RJ55_05606 [Drechmeria coniospora]|nr:hypothetical protein RJ55_05606 [Drechmeria coniospora]
MFSRTLTSNLLRQAARPVSRSPRQPLGFLQLRLLSDQTRGAIDKAIASAPVVLFMKGTPEMPQCGFSRGVIQILGLQGVNPHKFAAFNVLDDAELRQGIKEYSDWPTIPQLYVENEFIGGADIVKNLFKTGDLGKMFEDKGLLVEEADQQQQQP